jgi:predicted PurR-regulated permease PerM
VPLTETQKETSREAPPQRDYVRLKGSTFSMRVIAGAIILLFCYYAQGVVITVALSILLAYCLDPLVELLERIHVPRTLGALVSVLLLAAILGGVGYSLWNRTADFASNWPRYSQLVRKAVGSVEDKISGLEDRVLGTPAGQQASAQPAPLPRDPALVHSLLLRSIGSLYALFLEIAFLPFLVFFMLAGKRQAWHSTLQLFSVSRRTQVKETLDDLRGVLHDYLLGMTIVTLMVFAVSSVFFWFLGLDYPVLTGLASGILNMVPYIGAVLAWLPAFLLALAKWDTIGIFVAIAVVLTGIHILAQNLVLPHLVGRRVRLNAIAVTLSLLFWGWVWGGMGLVLAIPITASLRVLCDHTESWKPLSRWLSA